MDARSAIVAAAADLLHDSGVDAVTTRAVAAAAGVKPPAIYRQFGDKDTLLDVVAEHTLREHVTRKAASAAGEDGDPVEDLRRAWGEQVRFGLEHPAVFRLMTDPERAAASPAARAGSDALAARVRRVAAAGRLRVPERRAVELIHAAGTGAVLTQLALPEADRDVAVADALADGVLAQIVVPPRGATREADEVVPAAVALRALAPSLAALTAAERELLAEWLDRVLRNPS